MDSGFWSNKPYDWAYKCTNVVDFPGNKSINFPI